MPLSFWYLLHVTRNEKKEGETCYLFGNRSRLQSDSLDWIDGGSIRPVSPQTRYKRP